MKKIKISVIVPVYNTSLYLEKCLRSIMNQSLKEIEIICVNDGSIDNSLEILKEISKEEKRIKIINQINQGVSKARNEAIRIAKGKYCLNIDSDDWIESKYLEDMYNTAESNDSDIVISDIFFDFKYTPTKNYVLKDLNIKDNKNITGKEYIGIFIKDNFHGYTWNKLIKRELYIKNNIWYNEKIFIFEDVEVILRLAYHSKRINKLNKAYYHYLKYNSIASMEKKEKVLYDVNESFESLNSFFYKKNEFKICEILNVRWYGVLFFILLSINKKYDKYEKIILKLILKIKIRDLFEILPKIGISLTMYLFLLKIVPFRKTINSLKFLDKKIVSFLRKIKENNRK